MKLFIALTILTLTYTLFAIDVDLPHFIINLDLKPEERFREVNNYFMEPLKIIYQKMSNDDFINNFIGGKSLKLNLFNNEIFTEIESLAKLFYYTEEEFNVILQDNNDEEMNKDSLHQNSEDYEYNHNDLNVVNEEHNKKTDYLLEPPEKFTLEEINKDALYGLLALNLIFEYKALCISRVSETVWVRLSMHVILM